MFPYDNRFPKRHSQLQHLSQIADKPPPLPRLQLLPPPPLPIEMRPAISIAQMILASIHTIAHVTNTMPVSMVPPLSNSAAMDLSSMIQTRVAKIVPTHSQSIAVHELN